MVRIQMGVHINLLTEPKPDVAVFRLGCDKSKPAELVIEVSNTTLKYDRDVKIGTYAQVGLTEFWILNIPDRQLEVYREPAKKRGAYAGHTYRKCTVLKPGDEVALPGLEGVTVGVAEMFKPLFSGG